VRSVFLLLSFFSPCPDSDSLCSFADEEREKEREREVSKERKKKGDLKKKKTPETFSSLLSSPCAPG
jgi:hypothetical protein